MNSVRTDKELQRLRQSCRLALERYLDLASHESGKLTTFTPESISNLDRVNLLLLSQKEKAAHQSYHRAKAALLSYLEGTAIANAIKDAACRKMDGDEHPSNHSVFMVRSSG